MSIEFCAVIRVVNGNERIIAVSDDLGAIHGIPLVIFGLKRCGVPGRYGIYYGNECIRRTVNQCIPALPVRASCRFFFAGRKKKEKKNEAGTECRN